MAAISSTLKVTINGLNTDTDYKQQDNYNKNYEINSALSLKYSNFP